ncbi:MAG: hypothetical protein M3331_08485 [Actinomycetota bacterium]|nr:hypothetical protein [Actinomycetota bacterium]
MKTSDRGILIGLLVAGAFAAFWFLMLSPKRQEVAELGDKITQLKSDVSAQQQIVAAGRQAQGDYRENFSSLVLLGKAAPADGDMPSMLQQLVSISDRSDTTFGLLKLGTAPEEPEAAAAQTTVDGAEETEEPVETTPAAPTPVVPTEASASSLPIGATVGSAGLGRLAYDLSFQGDFFELADLFNGIDEMIAAKAANVDVGGRLITINGFAMTKEEADEPLDVELSISSYVLPESQGVTAGGTPTTPPASVPAATTTVAETP